MPTGKMLQCGPFMCIPVAFVLIAGVAAGRGIHYPECNKKLARGMLTQPKATQDVVTCPIFIGEFTVAIDAHVWVCRLPPFYQYPVYGRGVDCLGREKQGCVVVVGHFYNFLNNK